MARLKALTFVLDDLLEVLKGQKEYPLALRERIPKDAHVAGFYVDERYRVLVLHLWSAEYPEMPVGSEPERINQL